MSRTRAALAGATAVAALMAAPVALAAPAHHHGGGGGPQGNVLPFQNPRLPVRARVADLLSRMTLVGSDPPHAVDYELEVPSGMASRGRIALSADGAGTRVTWQHHIDFGGNPLERWRGLVVDAYLGNKFARGLDALAHAVAETRASHRDGA